MGSISIPSVPINGGTMTGRLVVSYDAVITPTDPTTAQELITNTNAGASGPMLCLFHDSPSPAADDTVGRFGFFGRNSVGAIIRYARMAFSITNATAGAESSEQVFETIVGGALTTGFKLRAGIFGDGKSDPGVNALHFNRYEASGNPATSAQFVTSGSPPIALANAANATIGDAAFSGLVVLTSNDTGRVAMFTCGGGEVIKVSGPAEYVASTSPSAGQFGCGFNGSSYALYNNIGSAQSHQATLFETRNSI